MTAESRQDACVHDGELRAVLDGELLQSAIPHLQTCLACRSRLEDLRAERDATALLLSRTDAQAAVNVSYAYQRLKRAHGHAPHQGTILEGVSWMTRITQLRWRTAFAGMLAIALMAIAITLTPVSTLAEDVLNRFRVQHFAAVTIPMDMDAQFDQGDLKIDPQMGAMVLGQALAAGDFETTFNHESFREAASVDEANAHLGGNLAAPSDLPAAFQNTEPRIFIGDAGSASYTFPVDQARMMLGFLGVDPAVLPDPAEAETITVSADMPASAAFVYDANGQHLLVGQVESPTLNLPESVDVELLRRELLAMPGLPADLVSQLQAIDDWESTLIIPVPSDATTEQQTVNGAPGLTIESQGGAAVLWQKDGILYAVIGEMSVDDALNVADSMD